MWNKDEMRGKADQIKGAIEKEVGNLLDDDELSNEGEADEAAGEAEETFGKERRKVGNAIKDVGDKLGR